MKDAEFAHGLEQFAICLHDHLCRANPGLNIIYSPLSIQISAAVLRMGTTEGSPTAKEMDEGLLFGGLDAQEVAESFGVVLKSYEQCQVLKMANGLYVMKGLHVDEQFGHILEKKFRSKPMEIDFGSEQAASIVNKWVESQTNNLIKDIIGPRVLTKDSRLCLVNGIHFKGEWSIRFNERDTQEEDFFGSDKHSRVRMMHVCEKFFFAVLPKFEATALRMNYSACNLAMIILLPDEKSDLTSLEKKLSDISLEALSSAMNLEKVDVKIPSFTAEFQQELSQVFMSMGMNRIFSGQAELGGMLQSEESLFVSKIVHKAFIEVNEVGTEAAAATAAVATFRSMPARQGPPKVFHANRPFFYAIKDNTHGLLFAGNFITANDEKPEKCNRCI